MQKKLKGVFFKYSTKLNVYELWRVSARVNPNGQLVELPEDFPQKHCPSHSLYAVCAPSMGIWYRRSCSITGNWGTN